MTEEPKLVTGSRWDRTTHWMIVATLALVLLVLIICGPILAYSASNNATAEAVVDNGELTACRTQFRLRTIDRTLADEVASTKDGLIAGGRGDQAVIDRILAEDTTAAERIDTAFAEYDAAVQRSREDPKGFLEDCRHDFPPEAP